MPPIISMFKVTFTDNTAEFMERIENGVEAAMKELGESVAERAKEYCPVDTGRLQESITATADGTTVTVGSDVEYAAYVELGTYKMSAQPYLRPALEECGGEAIEILKRNIE